MHRWLFVLAIAGCGGPPPTTAHVEAPPRALAPTPPQLAEGVTAMEALCAEGAEERCDAIDSDCDARIDEGCDGAEHGAIEIAVAWNAGADVDLVVRTPSGQPVLAQSRADCADPDDPRIERAAIEAPAAGAYHVELSYADACGTEGPLHASVSVVASGRSLGTFNRALAPGERAAVVSFALE